VDQRADIGLVLPPVAQAQPFGGFGQPLEKPVMHLLVKNETAGGGAALAGGAERSPEHTLQR
jgi:hypothetical protein